MDNIYYKLLPTMAVDYELDYEILPKLRWGLKYVMYARVEIAEDVQRPLRDEIRLGKGFVI